MAGADAGRSTAERRCPSCGALVGPGAEWCGQCFARLVPGGEPDGGARRREAYPVPAEPGPQGDGGGPPRGAAPSGTVPGGASGSGPPAWPCPTCGDRNPLDVDACQVCGTPFARLFEERRRTEISPRDAVVRSLLFPGAGHAALGRGGEGLLRGVLFAWTLGMAALFVSGWRAAAALVAGLYGAAALAVYVLSALEAHRVAEGGQPLVPTRAFLWGSVALIAASGLLVVLTIVAAAGR